MEINILFPRNKEEADYLIKVACAGKMSTRSEKSTTQILNERKSGIGTDVVVCNRTSYSSYKLDNCTRPDNSRCPAFKSCCQRHIEGVKKQKHWGVLEIPDMIVDIAGISRACSHQLVRHRLVSYLQQSQREVRISVDRDDWYVVPPTIQELDKAVEHFGSFREFMRLIAQVYQNLIKAGVDAEDARFVLPNACKTNILCKTNLRQWKHIEYMRLDKHAQWEIRQMATIILEKSKALYPLVFEDNGEVLEV